MLHVKKLTNEKIEAVRDFLSNRPNHSFGLTSFISRNKLESAENMGTFYGCLDNAGTLQAVALFGHFSLFEAATTAALQEIVRVARKHCDLHLLLGEKNEVDKFWKLYKPSKKLLHENAEYALLRKAASSSSSSADHLNILKKAAPADLEKVVSAHAQIILEERGYDPLERNAEKFRQRCLDRIENEQTWIYTQNQEIVFKAEIVCQTDDLAYLEGIWTTPELRNQGYGSRCLDSITQWMLQKSKFVYLLTEADNPRKKVFYRKAGFTSIGKYTASYLKNTT